MHHGRIIDKRIMIQYSSAVQMFSSNSATFIGCYMVCCLNMTAEDAFRKLTKRGGVT